MGVVSEIASCKECWARAVKRDKNPTRNSDVWGTLTELSRRFLDSFLTYSGLKVKPSCEGVARGRGDSWVKRPSSTDEPYFSG
jgi:hypothetical protein